MTIKKKQNKKDTNVPCSMFYAPCRNGFSLLEMIIAVAIFALVAVAAMSAYVNIFKAGKNAKTVQKNVENARGAMDIIAKTIRSGTIDGAPTQSDIFLFVYDAGSKTDGKCFKFSFIGNSIQEKQTAISHDRLATYQDCSSAGVASYYGSAIDLVNTSGFTVTGKFAATLPAPSAAGKVTILAKVQNLSGTDNANLQTTVTLSSSQEIAPN